MVLGSNPRGPNYHVDYKGYPILASKKVSDAALLEARFLIARMLADRDDLVKALIENKTVWW